MENLPLEVHIAPDGERVIEFIAAAERDPNAPCPDILLLDLNLPKIEGSRCCAEFERAANAGIFRC